MEIPTTLKHKPVFVCENYSEIDGIYAGKTDAQGLSLGLAQWNERGKVEISAKVWRHTGEKWSRQSEELPLHRVLDLAILICQAKAYCNQAYRLDAPHETTEPIARIGLQGAAMTVDVCKGNEQLEGDFKLVRQAFSHDDEMLSERLRRLAAMLKELGVV